MEGAPTLTSLARQLMAGFGFGMVFQMGFGPVSLAVVHKAINERWLAAWAMVWGVAFADGLYITLAALGVAALVRIPAFRLFLGIGGALALAYFGLRAWRAPAAEGEPGAAQRGLFRSLLYGIGVTLTNPLTVLFWGSVFGRLVLDRRFATPTAMAAFGLGCVTATLAAQTTISLLAGQARRFFSPMVCRWFNRVTGIFLIAFACKIALDLVNH